jgi:hypothetical protein
MAAIPNGDKIMPLTPTAQKLLKLLTESGPLTWYQIIAVINDGAALLAAVDTLKELEEIEEWWDGEMTRLRIKQ